MSEHTKISSSVRSIDGRVEIQFERTMEWNAPIQVTLGGETIEVHSGPLAQAMALVNLEGQPT